MPDIGTGGPIGGMSDYPVQLEKVQPPALRDDVLARDRLLDWLAVKVHGRVVLVTAEAGYGKTTLLADFARRTRLRVLWFRLDRGDRDWVGFIAHLVAAVRVHLPEFGASTSSLLRETGSSAPPLEAVLDTFLRELAELPPEPAALVFDDFHLVDDAPEIRHVVRELLARAPERLSFVFAARRTPPLRLARLRSLGEVAEIATDDLRFDATETERLFRETYAQPLEPGLLTELSRRTEGWAASLNLVRAAIHDRDAAGVRAFVRSLSGAEGHLYDYLAEEVVGDLPVDLQAFLLRTSVLDWVDLELGPVAAGVDRAEAQRLIDAAREVGLFGRQAPGDHRVRAHPLIREFLESKLAQSSSAADVRSIHLKVAQTAEATDWRTAADHYLTAGATADAQRVLAAALETILATGAYVAAEGLAARTGSRESPGSGLVSAVIASRTALMRRDWSGAISSARAAVLASETSDLAVWNAVMVLVNCGDVEGMKIYADRLEAMGSTELRLATMRAIRASVAASVTGDLATADRLYTMVGEAARVAGHSHFHAVALLNSAQLRRAGGDAEGALDHAERAFVELDKSSANLERVSTGLVQAWAMAHLGRLAEARRVLEELRSDAGDSLEYAFEAAEIEVVYGSPEIAQSLLAPFGGKKRNHDPSDAGLLTQVSIEIAQGRLDRAQGLLSQAQWGTPSTAFATEARRRSLRAYLSHLLGSKRSRSHLLDAANLASEQGSLLWSQFLSLISRLGHPGGLAAGEPVYLSLAAEGVVGALPVSDDDWEAVSAEASRRPERWRPLLRRALEQPGASTIQVAQLLADIGEPKDIRLLRSFGRGKGAVSIATAGRELARRLAPTVFIEDLGPIEIKVGNRVVQGLAIRRRVLGLLCYLLTKPRYRAQREEALDALWPDLDPEAALNSLNQTVYFLRRVIEPNYSEDLSPGYVGQNTEFVWLDPELVSSRSLLARESIREATRSGSSEDALAAARQYTGRFALDFLYDDWASSFRDPLNAAFLQTVERAYRADIESGQFRRGIELAQAAAAVEPDGEHIQAALVRLYRLSSAHTAAAEQYARYSALLRDLGVDPPPFNDV